MNNLNTTIDKIAMSEFDMHYYQLGDNEKQWCHDEIVNNPDWLNPFWKQDPCIIRRMKTSEDMYSAAFLRWY